jgi:hypothetical protein
MRTRRISTLLALAVVPVVLLAACGGDDSSSSSNTTASSSGSTTTTAKSSSGSSSCNGLKAGTDGIIRVFCDGHATAKVTIGTTQSTLTGGTCEEAGGYYTINFGAVAGPDFKGDKPDYIGALFPDDGSAIQAVTVRIGGAGGLLTSPTGNTSLDKQSVHIEGTTLTDHTPVTADIGC